MLGLGLLHIYLGVCCAQELRLVYNSNMLTKLDFQVSVEDRFAQKSIDVYRGFVQLYTDASQICHQALSRRTAADDIRTTAGQSLSKVPLIQS